MFDELVTDELVVSVVTYTVDPDDYAAAVAAHAADLESAALSYEVGSGSEDDVEDAASVRPKLLISATVKLVLQSPATDADVDLDLYGRRVEEIVRPGKRTIKRFVTLTSAAAGKYN